MKYTQIKKIIIEERKKEEYYNSCGFYAVCTLKERIKARVKFITKWKGLICNSKLSKNILFG